MIIGIDANEANVQNRVGAGQYAFNILQSLHSIDHQNQYYLYLKTPPRPDMPPPSPNWQYLVFGPKKLWTRIALPLHLFLNPVKPNLFLSLSHYSPLFSPIPTIPTIHDLGYLNAKSEFTSKDIHQLTRWTQHSLDHASHIIAVSQFTKNELERIYQIPSSKITVAPNGVGDIPKVNPQLTLEKFRLTKPFFLYLGTLKPNKNLSFLITSFSIFLKKKPDFNLVIAGKKGWLFEDIFTTVKKLKLTNKVIFTDYISETDKWSLLCTAKAFIIPSTYEGFGIPAIEAMKAGTPVIASRIPAFTEVVGDAGLFINPKNQNDLVNQMVTVLKPSIRQNLITLGHQQAKKYTWTNSAKKLISALSLV